ncbi:UNVERIFIED_CONTAM: hypothetical protein Sindi_2459700 [Sesamum indicum]
MLVQYEAMNHKSTAVVLVREGLTSKVKDKRVGSWKRKKDKKKVVATIASDPSAPTSPMGMGKGKRKVGISQQLKANNVGMHCQEKGHWKRECPQLLSNQGIFVIEVNLITNSASWVLDIDCGAHIYNNLQGHALETKAKLLNMMLLKTVPQMPYEIWYDKPAFYKYLRVWGSPAYVKKLLGDKLDSRSSVCIFIGSLKETVGYYFCDPSGQKVFVLRNTVFLEKGFPVDSRCDEVLLEKTSETPQ